jgi:hypothetical protein
MNTHKWILPVVMQARIAPAESPAETMRSDPPSRAARAILILALVAGGVGAGTAATSGHGTGDHSSAHHTGNIHPEASAYLTSTHHTILNPWMY